MSVEEFAIIVAKIIVFLGFAVISIIGISTTDGRKFVKDNIGIIVVSVFAAIIGIGARGEGGWGFTWPPPAGRWKGNLNENIGKMSWAIFVVYLYVVMIVLISNALSSDDSEKNPNRDGQFLGCQG